MLFEPSIGNKVPSPFSLSLSSSAPKNLMKLTNRVFIEQSEFLIFDTIKIQSTSIKLTFFKE